MLIFLLLASCKNDVPDTSVDTQPEPVDTDPVATDTEDTGEVVDDGKLRVTILHTNDWQSHMLGLGPNAEYDPSGTGDGTRGGLARVAALVNEIRGATSHPVVLFDAGDWMAGDLFQMLATSHAAELQVMQAIGYDAITLGNHEFDWGPGVLGDMIAKGDELGVTVPIVASNTVPDDNDIDDDALEMLFDSGRIQSSMTLELDNGLTLGLFGLLGDEAASISPAAVPTTFTVAADAAASALAELEGVDLTIALTHAGVDDDETLSADHLLASEVPGIDLIVGGHSHTPMEAVATAGDTWIVQAGYHTMWLGQVDLAWDGSSWELEDYTLHPIDDSVLGDSAITEMVDGFVADLDAGPLADLGTSFHAPVFSIPDDITLPECTEAPIANLVTDAYLWAMNRTADDPIDIAFENQGLIRDPLEHGNGGVQGFSDLFRVLPLGGSLTAPGYDLTHFYATAAEIKDVCEVTASVSPFYGCSYFIEWSSTMRCTVDTNQVPFFRAQSVQLYDGKQWVELDTSSDELFHVAVDSYIASLIVILEDLTSGLLEVTPKDAAGNAIDTSEGVTSMVFDTDAKTEGAQPLKLWQALADYADTFGDDDGDGVPDVPESYTEPSGRLIGWKK